MSLFFDYELPQSLIAQMPVEPRDHSRLLVVNRSTQTIEHRRFYHLPEYLGPDDLLVLNDTKVLPARLIGRRDSSGGKWEGLFLAEREGIWELLAQTRGFAQPGESFTTESGLCLVLVDRSAERHWLMKPMQPGSPAELLDRYGSIPLPPYIRKGRANDVDRERYQTVYAREGNSVAAPTAGLHFTQELLERLENQGIRRTHVTLHVGLGTFASIATDDPFKHRIHAEYCTVSGQTIAAIRECKSHGGRVIAVGTTSTRALETAGESPFSGESGLYIHPPYEFRVLDGLITNFHLPRTTLLLLVQSLTGSDLLKKAYDEAIREEYRFFSYGDAMLVI